MIDLKSLISALRGIGPKKAEVLVNAGLVDIVSLLDYFPRRYLDRNFQQNVILRENERISLLVNIVDTYVVHGRRSRLIVGARTLNNERISLVFFKGIQYFKNAFQPGVTAAVSGKLEYFRGFQLVHPDFEIMGGAGEPDSVHFGKIIPMYPSTDELQKEGFDSKGFRRIIYQILDLIRSGDLLVPENLPVEFLKKRNLMDRKTAYIAIHYPEDDIGLQKARERLVYEELFFFSILLEYKKRIRENVERKLWPLPKSELAEKLIERLPFRLTQDQELVISNLKKLSAGDSPIAVLLQGDVGSGKTLTAFLFALHYIENSIQTCIMAPTEILARQHFLTIYSLMNNSPFLGIDLLLGGEKEKQKKDKLAMLASGGTSILIGTHSLLQEEVKFRDLGLVIIDEQHKFGVEQRETLCAKGKNPDILSMTATPIPRTLCLAMFGDLKILTIKSKPLGRKPIVTKWITEDKRSAVYNSIRKYLEQGRQCYIIYPLIEESEKIDLKSCIDDFEKLKNGEFKNFKIGLLHGKMKQQEKEDVMHSFKKNEIKLLVTTTVVEVGVDVPNATVLLVEHAERFGISQLHQLRGRVGRGEEQSFCILMTSDKMTEEGVQRIQALVNHDDGFYLAEEDMKIRGPGELFGIRQSGIQDFKIADLLRDESTFVVAMEDASQISNIPREWELEMKSRFSEGRLLFVN